MRSILRALVLVVAISQPVLAHDPDKDKWADWFVSLRQPDAPQVSCCGPADQHWVDEIEFFPGDRTFKARVADKWFDVPANKVDWESINPTGRAVIFLSTTGVVYCFVPGLGM